MYSFIDQGFFFVFVSNLMHLVVLIDAAAVFIDLTCFHCTEYLPVDRSRADGRSRFHEILICLFSEVEYFKRNRYEILPLCAMAMRYCLAAFATVGVF